MIVRCLVLSLFFSVHSSLAQSTLDLPLADAVAEDQPTGARELRVISATLAPEQIDRAVLNRLMQEILVDPEATGDRFGIDAMQLQDMLTTLSNAHSFINDNEPANVQAMCKTWESSTLDGAARIDEALAAYARRAQFTKDFIATYYRVVLASIEAGLDGSALIRFNAYMEDRRRRMASAGAVTNAAVSQNARSGEESIRFHCRED